MRHVCDTTSVLRVSLGLYLGGVVGLMWICLRAPGGALVHEHTEHL